MACRDRTSLFIRYRESFRGLASRPDLGESYRENSKHAKKIDKQKLLDGNGDIEMGVMNEAPSWVRMVEGTMALFEIIRTKKEELSKMMGKSKRIGFDEDSERRRREEISCLADEISDLFRKCERNIQDVAIGLDKKDAHDLSMRKNVQSSLATTLHELSVTFRRDQKRYLEKLKENEAKSQYKPAVKNENFDFEDSGFTQAQLQELEDVEESVQLREKEIEKVADSIKELQTIFKELAVLIIDQGSIIDRIDYNIEKASEHTAKASDELVKAEKSQRRNPAMCCIIILAVALGMMSLILLMKILGYIHI
ncbi:syntaxin 16 [Guillardia theta CCMP2712]|uniref:Syntaxin 16 n=2 Tax=Guillardia theta TaxID=55529 RepID=L1JW60_GUITC|nr:syntaxin 16 [Guillardia theta CCMP2712]EKX52318.1 syntaxin 16 [Guillardia theta CCMP2712]|mmetsp:Transcript_13712/g.47524  ORF Transcript_13712/g.47524 Transcript_13712/m.47524 type:complete len:310 (+) Transcript_13712:287-1216(+)|eukprot:XP_005839298.1 syntaxin 16 [Guillardia theta CCMP2712]